MADHSVDAPGMRSSSICNRRRGQQRRAQFTVLTGLLGLLGFSIAPAKAVTPTQVVVVSLEASALSQANAPSPRQLSAQVRGALLDAGWPTLSTTPPTNAPCDLSCRFALGQETGADLVVLGTLHADDGALSLTLQLLEATTGLKLNVAATRGADRRALIRAIPEVVETLMRGQARTRQARPAQVMQPVTGQVSVGLAFILEFLIPSLGLFYADAPILAGIELVGVGIGMTMFISGLGGSDSVDTAIIGVLIAGIARIFGIVSAPIVATEHNDAQKKALMTQASLFPTGAAEATRNALEAPPSATFTLTIESGFICA